MRYVSAKADNGPHKGEWIVVDTRTGMMASFRSFATKRDADSEARWLNDYGSD